MQGHIAVVDVGKTQSKVTLWAPSGRLVARRMRANQPLAAGAYQALDATGIEEWLVEALTAFAGLGDVEAIIPVAHGAALAVLRDGALSRPPVDYEQPMPPAERERYDAGRDSFARTGSPALPAGLNAGAQLHFLESLDAGALSPGATIVTWAQYWAWVLCGVPATEVTSLGCHTDLWCPLAGEPSSLALRRGWAARFAPLRRADECLGTLRPEWSARTGLGKDVRIYCGLHDSNAALLAARGSREVAREESTVLSTGTWFVAMRSPAPNAIVDCERLPEERDCLVNVDVFARPIPSARFMGGREIETLTGIDTRRIDIRPDQGKLLAALPETLHKGAVLLPTFAAGCGPFPHARGRWVDMPGDGFQRRALVSLYAALVADVSLDLIGARERLVVEGRFAEAQVFVRALATLRPETAVYAANAENDVSYGALRLVIPDLALSSALTRVVPLDVDLSTYRGAWRSEAERMERAA